MKFLSTDYPSTVSVGQYRIDSERGIRVELADSALQRLTDPRNYLGEAPQMVDRALALSRAHTASGR